MDTGETMSIENAGRFRFPISICKKQVTTSENGFPKIEYPTILNAKAEIKTTRGMTLIANDTDFEKAYTRFSIRYPKHTQISRNMFVKYNGQYYSIEYLNNVDERNIELEMQCKLVDINKDGEVPTGFELNIT